jgi:hypothetical protein
MVGYGLFESVIVFFTCLEKIRTQSSTLFVLETPKNKMMDE